MTKRQYDSKYQALINCFASYVDQVYGWPPAPVCYGYVMEALTGTVQLKALCLCSSFTIKRYIIISIHPIPRSKQRAMRHPIQLFHEWSFL